MTEGDRLIVLSAKKRTWRSPIVPRFIVIGLLGVLIVIGPSAMFRLATFSHVYLRTEGLPHASVALLLGASVSHGALSPVLAERADAAVRLYQEGRVEKILVSGDSREKSYDEVTPVRTYLIEAGIPASDIFLDRSGLDTYSSMYRARAVFGARSLIVVTQDFHLPRAVFLARYFDIDASGFAAGAGSIGGYLREIPATWKALWDLVSGRQPKYIGAPMPLVGTGNI